MTIYDDNWFNDLLQNGNETAPAELRAQLRQLIAGESPDLATPPQVPSKRRWVLPITIAAATIVTITGLALTANRGNDTIAPTQTTNPITSPTVPTIASTIPTTSTTPTTTAPTLGPLDEQSSGVVVLEPSGVPVVRPVAATPEELLVSLGLDERDGVRTVSGRDALALIETIEAYRIEVLRSASGFTATSMGYCDDFPGGSCNELEALEITMLDTGAMWIDFASGYFFEFDPATRVYRRLFRDIDGTVRATEDFDWPWLAQVDFATLDATLPLAITFEVPPELVMEISATSFEGRPALQLISEPGSDVRDAGGAELERFVVDLTSGLRVESGTDDPSNLSNVEVVGSATMPTRQLPAGVNWEELPGDDRFTTTLQVMSVEQAAASFGSDLLLPAGMIENGTLAVDRVENDVNGDAVGEAVGEPESLDAVTRSVGVIAYGNDGLTRIEYWTSVERSAVAGTTPDGYVHIDDHLCPTPCENEGATLPTMTPQVGPLAGVPFSVLENGWSSVLSAESDGVSYFIRARSLDQALNTINTLIAVTD